MRRKREISLTLMTTAASCFVGACAPSQPQTAEAPRDWQWQQCVDDQGNIVPDEKCEQERRAGGGMYPYYWWYIMGGRPLGLGSNINGLQPGQASRQPFGQTPTYRGGQFSPSHPAHPSYRPATNPSTTRGIFGSGSTGRGVSA